MKIRNGFVSNSSSSSFTCDVCGENVSGMDMSPGDAEMYSCGKHNWCETHYDPSFMWENINTYEKAITLLDNLKTSKWIYGGFKEQLDKLSEEQKKDSCSIENAVEYISGDLRCEIPKSFCPVCTLKTITPEIESMYLLLKDGRSREELHQAIRDDCKDLSGLTEMINSINNKE